MSRIGKKPLPVPAKVTVTISDGRIKVKGPKGEIEQKINESASVTYDEGRREIRIERKSDSRQARAVHGLQRALISNMIVGVTEGYTRGLEVHGTGYAADVKGKELVLQVGLAVPAAVPIPDGVKVEIQQRAAQPTNPAKFTISCMDKQKIGQFAADIRKIRPPEPYNGKGIRYAGEQIRRKEGKAAIGSGVRT